MPAIRVVHRYARNRAIHARFKELYEQERMRLDDVYQRLAQEFFLSERTIDKVLRLPYPKEEAYAHAAS